MNTEIIPILMPGMSLSDQNTLQLILSRRLGVSIQKGFPETVRPHLIIANLDRKKTLEDVSRYKDDYSGVPIIGLSFQAQSLEGVKVLPRPFKMDILVDFVKEYLKKPADRVQPASMGIKPKISIVKSGRKTAARSATHLNFSQNNSFVEMLHDVYIKSIAEQRNIRIVQKSTSEQPEEFIFTKTGYVFCKHKRGVIRSLCSLYNDSGAFRKKTLSDSETSALTSGTKGFVYDGEKFFWEVLAGCFRHKLPDDLTLTAPLAMERWPNCIVLRHPVQGVTISSVLHQGAISIEDIISRTGLPKHKVIEFVATAYSLGFLRKASVTTARKSTGPHAANKSSSAISSLVRRVAKRLFGSK